MCAMVTSRNGLTISTSSPSAADLYQEGLDLVLSQNYGPEPRLRAAVEADDGFAMAHVVLAYVLNLQLDIPGARAAAEKAVELSAGASRQERQAAQYMHAFTHGKGTEAISIIHEHLGDFPTDTLALRVAQRLYMLGCFGAGVPDFPNHLMKMMTRVAPFNGEDWAFLGQYAFAHHETNQPEKAMDLATRSLEGNPQNAVACHSVTHSYFEQGDAANGGQWLADWLDGFDRRASYNTHLSWHLALFELAQGRYQQALDLYETHIRPGVKARNLANLADSASLCGDYRCTPEKPRVNPGMRCATRPNPPPTVPAPRSATVMPPWPSPAPVMPTPPNASLTVSPPRAKRATIWLAR